MCSALGLLTAAPGRHSTARGDASSGGCFAGPLPGHGDAQRCAVWAPWRPAALPFTTAQRCTESKSTAAPLRLCPAPPRIAASGTAPPARPKPPRLQKRRGKAQRFAALRVHPSADPRSPPPRTHHGAAGGAGSERAGPVSGAERGGGAGLRGGHACAHSDGAEGKKGGGPRGAGMRPGPTVRCRGSTVGGGGGGRLRQRLQGGPPTPRAARGAPGGGAAPTDPRCRGLRADSRPRADAGVPPRGEPTRAHAGPMAAEQLSVIAP